MFQEGLTLEAACSSIAHDLVGGLQGRGQAGDHFTLSRGQLPLSRVIVSRQDCRPSFARSSRFSEETIPQFEIESFDF